MMRVSHWGYNRSMLSLWRRHTPKCPQAKRVKKRSQHRDGRSVVNCDCPIWVDGELNGKRFRRSAGTRDWQRALRKVAAWENPDSACLKPLSDAIEAFGLHCRDLAPSTQRKYGNTLRHLEEYCNKVGVGTLAGDITESCGWRGRRAAYPDG